MFCYNLGVSKSWKTFCNGTQIFYIKGVMEILRYMAKFYVGKKEVDYFDFRKALGY